jgi:protein gp37
MAAWRRRTFGLGCQLKMQRTPWHLHAAQASVKFVSFEPLLGPVGKVDLTGIDWAIVGGESGPLDGAFVSFFHG